LLRQRRVAAGSGLGTGLGATIKHARRTARGRKQRPWRHDQATATLKERLFGQRPGHHYQLPATRNVAAGSRLGTGLGTGTTIKYLRRTASGTAGNCIGTTIKYLRRTRNGFSGYCLGTTIKYL
jgi:hypothetical protein